MHRVGLESENWIRLTAPGFHEVPFWARDAPGDNWERDLARDDVYGHLNASEEDEVAVDRDWAATAQRAFELEVLDILSPYLTARVPDFDGLAISGGCALNVLSNSRVERVLNVPVSVP